MLCNFPPRLTVQRVGTKGQSLAQGLQGDRPLLASAHVGHMH